MEVKEPASVGKNVAQRCQAPPSESSEETETSGSCSGEFQSLSVEVSSPVLDTSAVLEVNPVLGPAAPSLESSDVPNSGKVERPGPYDVLLGRGRSYQIHQGNRRLHKIVAAHKPFYLRSKQKRKCEIAKMVMKLVKESNSEPVRFLRREECFWVEVPSEVAREKVSHALRCKAKKADTRSGGDPSEDSILICPPFGRPLMGAVLSTPVGAAYGNRPLKPMPYDAELAPVSPAVIYMNSVSLPTPSPPSWGQAYPRPGPAMGELGVRLAAPESYIPRMLRAPYGMQIPTPRGPRRSYSAGTPVGMLSDDQILEILQRRQARTFVPNRPEFPPFFKL
jgi:hypothetical protein